MDEPSIDPVSRPARLLPAGRADSLAAAAVPTRALTWAPDRALAADARFVLELLRATASFDRAWSEPSFERTVDTVRGQLAPVGSRRVLAGSFDREAFRRAEDPAATEPAESPWAIRLAYAIRWLELGDGALRPPWAALRPGRGCHLRPVERRRRSPGSRRRR